MSRVLRAYHPDVRGPGSLVTLDAEESHHVARVLRLAPGDALRVFDGRGREWEGVVTESTRNGTVLRIGAECSDPVEVALPVDLFLALCRPERVEWAIQKATEVGVASIRVCPTLRSEGSPPSAERLLRWQRVAREAVKQSGRRRVPEVLSIAEAPLQVPRGILGLLFDRGASARPAGGYLAGPRPERVWILVGPAGGLDDAEVAPRAAAGWRIASLGPRALRAETAAVVATALVLHAFDDLGGSTGR